MSRRIISSPPRSAAVTGEASGFRSIATEVWKYESASLPARNAASVAKSRYSRVEVTCRDGDSSSARPFRPEDALILDADLDWDVASGGRMGFVTGEDAVEVANPPTDCVEDCQAQNQVRGRLAVLGFPFPVPAGSRLVPRA